MDDPPLIADTQLTPVPAETQYFDLAHCQGTAGAGDFAIHCLPQSKRTHDFQVDAHQDEHRDQDLRVHQHFASDAYRQRVLAETVMKIAPFVVLDVEVETVAVKEAATVVTAVAVAAAVPDHVAIGKFASVGLVPIDYELEQKLYFVTAFQTVQAEEMASVGQCSSSPLLQNSSTEELPLKA